MIKKISYYIGIVFLWILTIGAASEAKTVIGSIVILIPLIILMLRQYLGMKARKLQKELSEAKNNYEEMIKPDMNILGLGMKLYGSSALMRHSKAWPSTLMSFC